MAPHKACTKCGEDKPLSEFYKNKRARDGLQYRCKSCQNLYAATYKAAHPDRVKAAVKAWQTAHPERVLAAAQRYREAHPDRTKAAQKAWEVTHTEERAAYKEAYYAENQDYIRAASRAYYHAHVEERAAYKKTRYAANPEPQRAAAKTWAATHSEERRAYERRYFHTAAGKAARARSTAKRRIQKLRTDATVALTAEEWQARIAEYGSHCCWCGKELTEDEIVMDHIVALANGGGHTASNVAPSCKSCNSRKRTQDWDYPYPGMPRDDAQPEGGSEWL